MELLKLFAPHATCVQPASVRKFRSRTFIAMEIPTGWHVVLYKRCHIGDQILAKLSAAGEVVSCFVEDHVMFSSASGWNRGSQVWKVFHDNEKGRYHLGITGNVPAVLADIRKRWTEKQDEAGGEEADVDYVYDIPVATREKPCL